MAIRILLVDPDEEWLEKSVEFFKERNYDVDTAMNGRDAQIKTFSAQDEKRPYFFVVLNLEVQNHSGMQVMKFMKTRNPHIPVILITTSEDFEKEYDFSEEKASHLGAHAFLPRPFEMIDLLTGIEGPQTLSELLQTLPNREGSSEDEEIDMADELFTSVGINEFIPNKRIIFDVYIKLKSGRYLKILHAGDDFEKERLAKYREDKNVKHLHFHIKDRKKYIRYCNHLSAVMINKSVGSAKGRAGILHNCAEKFLEEVETEGIKPLVLEQGKEIVSNLFDMVEKDKELFELFKKAGEFNPQAYSHAYLVSLFCAMTIKQFEWQSRVIIETASFAGLMHDIGKLGLPPDIQAKHVDQMTEEEIEEYKKHPEYGAKMLESNPLISNSIKQIVIQHHEYSDGTGFPKGVKDQKIQTLAKVVSMADIFSNYVLENDCSPKEAIGEVLKNKEISRKMNGEVVKRFMMAFIDPSSKSKDTKLSSKSKIVSSKI